MRIALASALVLSLLGPARAAAQEPGPQEILGLIEAGQLERAEQVLRALLAEREGIEERDLLGVVLSRQGRFDEAVQQFASVLEVDPARPSTQQNLARLYLLQERHPEALSSLRAAARLGELERGLAFSLASLELRIGDRSAAEAQLRSLAERFDSVSALLLLARLRSDAADFEGSVNALERALELAPNSEAALEAYARTALEADAPVAAVVALDSLTRMHPRETRYFYLAGIARLQARDVNGAIEALRIARQQDPKRVSILVALGLALNTQKHYSEAADLLRVGLQLDPDDVDALAGIAEAEEGVSNLASAETYALLALEKDSGHPIANLTLGMVRMKQREYDAARAGFEKVLASDPGSPKAHYQLSLAYARLGDMEQSKHHRELYQRALDTYEEGLRRLDAETGRASAGMGPGR